MAEDQETPIRPEFPIGRVKKIMKLDKDINKINSEALHLITYSTELFLHFLAEKSAVVAVEKKRKTVSLDHLRTAVKRHQPTSDFLLDSLPLPSQPVRHTKTASDKIAPPTPPVGTRRIDDFFSKGKAKVADSA
ncbi:PREDICTED: nuclear transcription factor Y subunit gamma-like [Camelina sativa]|uniref:Nuclear transcription factor Y subunit gamma-like n=1 Tax=Camelina sativa TaxID=90675 RepID=A0ABM0Y239_CAMSA|nr:PREDICTED: nuclear transcription factor Y subunit gamma-like [Camelina sativa]XP_010494297.1 PREDICTED: nuclear transcription factor Y subunit gamma-like [Camelina sativa]